MSEKKPLLQTILDQLDEEFDELARLWRTEPIDKEELVTVQNRIHPLPRVLRAADLGEAATETRERLLKMRRPGTDWSAASVQAITVFNELERK